MKGFSEMNNDELRQMRHDTLMEILNILSKFFFVHDSEMLLMSHGGLTSVHLVTHSLMIDRSIHRPLLQSEGFQLEKKLCVTAYDFVTAPACKGPTLYDMELGLILGLDFTDVRCIKVVSDHLDLEEYTRNVETDGKMD